MKYILIGNNIIATHDDRQEVNVTAYHEDAILIQGDYKFPTGVDGEYLPLSEDIIESIYQKSFIKTSIGYLKKQTKVGDLLSIFNTYAAIVAINKLLPANVLLIYRKDKTSFFNEQMTEAQFYSLFNEVTNAYLEDFNS